MNDYELLTAVRNSMAVVHSTTPVDQIVSRGRVRRARNRIPVLAGALVVMVGTALAATALLSASPHPSHLATRPVGRQAKPGAHPKHGNQATEVTAAWTVAEQANGDIRVTIREMRDPAGLQHRLRADGVPASVTFFEHGNPACQSYGSAGWSRLLGKTVQFYPGGAIVLVIRPSALPRGVGLRIESPGAMLGVGLVEVSPNCTGT